jgi:hypothetical protein
MKYCTIKDCKKKLFSRGLCTTHYSRYRNSGVIKMHDTMKRFWDNIEFDDFCWNWKGCLRKGYGCFRVDGITYSAHRFSYMCNIGEIPDGMQIDHLCKNKSCVNPDHLEIVTSQENTRRGFSDDWYFDEDFNVI